MLVEAAKKGARRDVKLNQIYEPEKQRGNPNQATIAVARQLVAYLLACDRENRVFRPVLAAENTGGLKQDRICNARRPGPAGT